ncbi:DUF7219 family protein [Lyngbya aestuarii]|uniref:DUF7219 family protein n=1 Tax=Lyngbya aestuarii TaxID=118322 RepID=UPI00403D5C98
MTQEINHLDQIGKNRFMYPTRKYRGLFKPEYLAFDANLQEFSQQVSYISCLETAGKLSPQQAYEQLDHLWKRLKRSAQLMGIEGTQTPETR